MKKKVNIVMLPTEDKTNVAIIRTSNKLVYINEPLDLNNGFQHLYITISPDVESIKDGDWVLLNYPSGYEVKQMKEEVLFENAKFINVENYVHNNGHQKIIATTDPKLTVVIGKLSNTTYSEKIPQVQQSFLKEYVDNSDGEWEVEYEEMGAWINRGQDFECTSIKPKLNQDNTVNITLVKEKMYNRDEVLEAFCAGYCYCSGTQILEGDEWINQNL